MNVKAEWINWKRVVIFCSTILFILILLYVIFFFRTIAKSKLVDFEQTEHLIYNQTEITSIEEAYQFQDETSYHIVYGQDDAGEEFIVFAPLEKNVSKEDLVIVSRDSIQSKEQIESSWKKDCQSCTLTGSTPAIIHDKPLWELTYTDEFNGYVIEYISLENGSTYEKMRLYRNYNKKG